jgi:chromosomal replication initiator protein
MKGTAAANVQEVWEEALAVIRGRISRQSFEAWFRPLTLGTVEENRVQILLPNRFFKEWFEDHYLGLLRSALEDLLFNKVEIRLVLPEKDAAATPASQEEPSERRAPRRPRDAGAQLNPKYTFDSFVVGTSNQFAHAACMAVGEQLAKTYNPLFIYGGTMPGNGTRAFGSRMSLPRSSPTISSTRSGSTPPWSSAIGTAAWTCS